MREVLSKIKNSIQQGDYQHSIDQLLEVTKSHSSRFANEVILHAAGLKQIRIDERKGIADIEGTRRELKRITYALLDLIDNIEQELTAKGTKDGKEVFISYSWSDEDVVNEIDCAFKEQGVILKRDKREATYKADIKAFMQQIGKGNYVVLIVSDSFLKKRNCMYEVLELMKHEKFRERIFPIVLPDAKKIYNAKATIEYIKFWDKEITELNRSLKSVDNLANTNRIYEEINHCEKIRSSIDSFIETIQNMNTLTLETHRQENYQSIFKAIKIPY